MGNTIGFRFDRELVEKRIKAMIEHREVPPLSPDDELDLTISNIGTAVFINVLCLSGGRLAKTESQKRFMVYLAERNQEFMGLGVVGFHIVEMPWVKDSFEEDKNFMLSMIDGAKNKLGWETLDYEPNEEVVFEYLEAFRKLIERMTVDDIEEKYLTEWLSQGTADDPVNCGFPKCEKHDTYISIAGCQVCME